MCDAGAKVMVHRGHRQGAALLPADAVAEGLEAALQLGFQAGELLALDLILMRQALRRHGRQMRGIDLLDFQLQAQQRQQIVAVIGLVDSLHQ